ncbi:MAG: MarR family winged helix-turn-helix transcriptional regulator [Candidatus Promineifilaceae bacterium]|jgi:DNA-binding MarR family transcriptional regulator
MTDTNLLAKQLLEIVPAVMRVLSAEIRASGQLPSPAQFSVMVTLAYHPCNLSNLAELNGVSLPTMSSTINTLSQRGWVRRTRSSVDRRVVNVEITEDGMNQLLEIQSHAEQKLQNLLRPLNNEDQNKLADGLKIISSIFDIAESNINSEDCID